MIKTVNKECITFNEPRNYFYLINVLFLFIFFPSAKCRSKITMEEIFDFEDIDFLILNQNELFIEEKNPPEGLVISKEEIAEIKIRIKFLGKTK